MRVLISHSRPQVRDGVAGELREQGMAVDVANTTDDALGKAAVHDYDVIVLDRILETTVAASGAEPRIRVVSERARPPTLTCGDLVLDPARREVTRRGKPLDLTRKELGVLEELLGAQGATVSTEQLLTRVWDENVDPFTNIVRVTVMTLRRKLGEPPLIETVNGVGYRAG
jgi:DNA-binding response OmpR family regulator